MIQEQLGLYQVITPILLGNDLIDLQDLLSYPTFQKQLEVKKLGEQATLEV